MALLSREYEQEVSVSESHAEISFGTLIDSSRGELTAIGGGERDIPPKLQPQADVQHGGMLLQRDFADLEPVAADEGEFGERPHQIGAARE